jgi:hypothetical protein
LTRGVFFIKLVELKCTHVVFQSNFSKCDINCNHDKKTPIGNKLIMLVKGSL